MSIKGQKWLPVKPRLSVFKQLPTPVFMKAKNLEPYSKVIAHLHDWDQLIYAVSGILEVQSEDGSYLLPPQQSIWIPANQKHSIATIKGAKLRSVHFEKGLVSNHGDEICVLKISPLVRELILKASDFNFTEDMNQQQWRLLEVLADEIAVLDEVALHLPLSNDPLLLPIITFLQLQPDSSKSLQQWSTELGASSKTISRRFNTKLGMSYSRWLEQLRLHKAIHWLIENRSVTRIALDLGYGSLPAFIQMFKRNTGITPGKFTD